MTNFRFKDLCVWVVCLHLCLVPRGQKTSGPLELKLERAVSHPKYWEPNPDLSNKYSTAESSLQPQERFLCLVFERVCTAMVGLEFTL